MPLSAKAQFVKRANEALKQGNTRFVARGENKKLFEEMKRKFEQEQNAQSEPDSKMMKLSNPSSSSSDSEENSPQPPEVLNVTESEINEAAPIELQIEELSSLTDEAQFETEINEAAPEELQIEKLSSLTDEALRKHKDATQPAKRPVQYNHEAAMAWQTETQRSLEVWQAYSKKPEANRVWCMADCEPSGHRYRLPSADDSNNNEGDYSYMTRP